MNPAAVDQVAQIFMRARQTGERLDSLPAAIAPKNFIESCAVMDAVDRLVGDDIVGTKIAAKPGAEVVYAPLPAGRIFHSPARIPRALQEERAAAYRRPHRTEAHRLHDVGDILRRHRADRNNRTRHILRRRRRNADQDQARNREHNASHTTLRPGTMSRRRREGRQ